MFIWFSFPESSLWYDGMKKQNYIILLIMTFIQHNFIKFNAITIQCSSCFVLQNDILYGMTLIYLSVMFVQDKILLY